MSADSSEYVWAVLPNEGLERLEENGKTVFNMDNTPMPNNNVTAMYSESSGSVWIACEGGYLLRFDGITWSVFSPDETSMPSIKIHAIAVDEKGNKWIGTNHGLVIFNEQGVDIAIPVAPSMDKSNRITAPIFGTVVSACSTMAIELEKAFGRRCKYLDLIKQWKGLGA